jgi:hypothetical protein
MTNKSKNFLVAGTKEKSNWAPSGHTSKIERRGFHNYPFEFNNAVIKHSVIVDFECHCESKSWT